MSRKPKDFQILSETLGPPIEEDLFPASTNGTATAVADEANTINECGQPVDVEQALEEHFAGADAECAAVAEAAGVACLSPLELDSLKAKADHLRKIEAKNQEVVALQIDHMHKAESAKDVKKAWEAASQSLSRMIAMGNEKLPLFDQKNEGETTDEAAPDEDWRDVGIDILSTHGCSEATLNHLEKFEIETIGDLADWTAGKNKFAPKPHQLTDVPGVGEKAAAKIEAALEGFWATWHHNETVNQDA